MAKKRYFVKFEVTATGAGIESLTPTWEDLFTIGTPSAVPAAVATPDTVAPISEVAGAGAGGGLYYFDWDPTTSGEIVGVIDGGTGATGVRYVNIEIRKDSQTLATVATDAADARKALFNKLTMPADGVGVMTLYEDDAITTHSTSAISNDGGTRTRTPV